MEDMKRKGGNSGRTPGPQLDRMPAKKNFYYKPSGSVGRNRDRQVTRANSNETKRDDEEWSEFPVHGKRDIQEMNMMLREIGLSPLQLGLTADDWDWGKQRETESPDGTPQYSSSSPNEEGTYVGDFRTLLNQCRVGDECQQSSERSTSAESASSSSPAVVAVGHNFVREDNGHHSENAQTASQKGGPSTVSNYPRMEGVDGNHLQCGSVTLVVGLQPEDSPSRPAAQRQTGAEKLEPQLVLVRTEPLLRDHMKGMQTTSRTAPPIRSLTSRALHLDRLRKQEGAEQSRGFLKPPPMQKVLPIGRMLSTADMINSLAPDAAEEYKGISSDSEDEEKEEEPEGDDWAEPSPSSSTVEKETMNHLSKEAGIVSRERNQPDKTSTKHENGTDGELPARQVGEKVAVESANEGPAVMNLTTVSNCPDTGQPVVSRTSSMYMEGPKFPWMKGSRLGAGAFGTVYSAVDSGGMFFAVKEVSISEQDEQALQALAQLKQEVELLKKFKHRNIVQYLGTDQGADKLYIFLELAELGSLAAVYKNFELADSQISNYTRDILRGLEYLHNRKIMHRDIKCANILVDKMGTCKLADFGLAKQISSLDLAKSFKGSAYWMAPEVINPQKTYGLPADIWSLGCSVLELATRAPPFGQMEWYRVMFTVGRGNAPPIPDNLSDLLRDFVKSCFKIEPKERPTATELLQHPFIFQDSGLSANSGRHLLPRSTTDLQLVTEDRWSDFQSPQSSQESASIKVEGRGI